MWRSVASRGVKTPEILTNPALPHAKASIGVEMDLQPPSGPAILWNGRTRSLNQPRPSANPGLSYFSRDGCGTIDIK